MSLSALKEEYVAHNQFVRARRKEIQHELDARHLAIRRAQEEIEQYEKELASSKLQYHQPDSFLVPALAAELAERLGMEYFRVGPCGMDAATVLFFHQPNQQPDRSIVIVPSSLVTSHLLYETGERKGLYADDSLGFMQGKDYVLEPLPESIDDILPLIRKRGETRSVKPS